MTITERTVLLDDMDSRLVELKARRADAIEGRHEQTEAQHSRGKYLARERIEMLLDEGTFVEIGLHRRHRAHGFNLEQRRPATDGVITGWGLVEGRKVFVYAHDFRVFGGSLGEAHASKIQHLLDLAVATKCPMIALNDGAGARIQEGVSALAGYGGIFRRISQASGVIPQISVIMGPCAGGAAYSPALTDFVFMVRGTANMFITGPDVVESVTGERVSAEDLGGADVHGETSGVSHFTLDSEEECIEHVRYLISILPSSSNAKAPTLRHADADNRLNPGLMSIVPLDGSRSYDVRGVIEEIADEEDFFEVQQDWGKSLVCGFAHFSGELTGVVASQPQHMAGALDITSSEKGARFVQFCDSFNIQLLTLVDVPGFLPGTDQEHDGIIRHGAKLVYAYCTATVPRVTVILRKAYGGAYIVMDSQSVGADVSLAWPSNEVAVMGAESAVDLIFGKQIAASDAPAERRDELIQEYQDELMNPYSGVQNGLLDEVIDPAHTRRLVIESFKMLSGKISEFQPKHGNQPI